MRSVTVVTESSDVAATLDAACHPNHSASMKVAALALLVASVASASVRSNEKASVKELGNLNEVTIGEVAAAVKLLARERPHQSFLQNDLEQALGAKN